jgi:hypothetical protein
MCVAMSDCTTTCPLCHQSTEGFGRAPKPPSSLGKTVSSILEDVESWAEGDVLANDGGSLSADDLVRYLTDELAPVLMKMYAKRIRYHKANHRVLQKRITEERDIVSDVEAGRLPTQSLRGRHGKDACLRGHPRTPDNVHPRTGACMTCRREQKRGVEK